MAPMGHESVHEYGEMGRSCGRVFLWKAEERDELRRVLLLPRCDRSWAAGTRTRQVGFFDRCLAEFYFWLEL